MMSYDPMGSVRGIQMSEQAETETSETPSKARAGVFIVLLACYYGLYGVMFALRIGEYVQDLLKHFAFFRRLW